MKPICRNITLPLIGILMFLLGMVVPGKAGSLDGSLDQQVFTYFRQTTTAQTIAKPAIIQVVQQQKLHQASSGWVHARFEKKRRIKFLVRHLQHQPAARKVVVRENFELASADDPDHEPVPDENWHTRPRYYIFLFRLCPF